MWQRCTTPENPNYARYGGRGIRVCERWKKFENFFADMGKRPSPKHSIERKDNDGDYTPKNCVWATREEQANNTRRNRYLTHNGETLTLEAWAKRLGLSSSTLSHRLTKGWPLEEVLTTKRWAARGPNARNSMQ